METVNLSISGKHILAVSASQEAVRVSGGAVSASGRIYRFPAPVTGLDLPQNISVGRPIQNVAIGGSIDTLCYSQSRV